MMPVRNYILAVTVKIVPNSSQLKLIDKFNCVYRTEVITFELQPSITVFSHS